MRSTATARPSGAAAGGAQEQWLRQDLAANPRACTLAYWHHPRFTSGGHGNTTAVDPLWQALIDHHADVVLNGHDHGYQRWRPLNASGGASATGVTEFVVGTGGTSLTRFRTTKPANNLVRDAATHGVLKLTLRDSGYDWHFIPITGQTFTDTGSADCH